MYVKTAVHKWNLIQWLIHKFNISIQLGVTHK